MLRVATFNVNGIRAAHRRGLGAWLDTRGVDVVALQEVRAPVAALPEAAFGSYHAAYDPGRRAGRNGVAVLTRRPPAAVRAWDEQVWMVAPGGPPVAHALPPRVGMPRALRGFAGEGRYVEVDLADHPVTIASVYVPKGGLPAELHRPGRMREAPDGGLAFARKLRFLDGLTRLLPQARRAAARAGRHFLLVGDLNVAPSPLDLTAWRRQVRNPGFLPQEREWIAGLLGPRRLLDPVRLLHPDTQGPYSWWSWLGDAFATDTGWRIDLHLAAPALARRAIGTRTDRPAEAAARMSDHAPVVVDYDL